MNIMFTTTFTLSSSFRCIYVCFCFHITYLSLKRQGYILNHAHFPSWHKVMLILLLLSRTRLSIHCVPSGCGLDACAPTVVHLFLHHAPSFRSWHTSKIYMNIFEERCCLSKKMYSSSFIVFSVCRHGGGDDVYHRHVSHCNAKGRQTWASPPLLLPHMFLLSACLGYSGQYQVLEQYVVDIHSSITVYWKIWNSLLGFVLNISPMNNPSSNEVVTLCKM